jgi:hypothetical protein
MKKAPSEESLERAKLLSEEETERLMSRMRAKLMRRLEDKKLTKLEVVAIQLELEDEELQEWRAKMAEVQSKSKNRQIQT